MVISEANMNHDLRTWAIKRHAEDLLRLQSEDDYEEKGGKVDDQQSNNAAADKSVSRLYPLRPYAEDCNFYLKTGFCKWGLHCKYNHTGLIRFPSTETATGTVRVFRRSQSRRSASIT